MKKFIFTLNPDDLVYGRAIYAFLARNHERIDSVCIFPNASTPKKAFSYQLTVIRVLGWRNSLYLFISWNIKKWIAKVLGGSEIYSIEKSALSYHIPVRRFQSVNGEDFIGYVQSRPNIQALFNICSQIYKSDTIDRLPPIYNFHGGYIPGNRGRFPMFWAYMKNLPQVLTCHRVTKVIDDGEPIYHFRLPATPRDGVYELMRLTVDVFPKIVERVIELIDENKRETLSLSIPSFYGPEPTRDEIRDFHARIRAAKSFKFEF